MSIYLDCNATSPLDPEVLEAVIQSMTALFGNASSRTHEYGTEAKQAVENARNQIARILKANKEEVIFTSGATESNNISILGLTQYGSANNKKHIISTQIEHKAVLEPLAEMEKRGFDITLIQPNKGGWIEPQEVLSKLRKDTLLVSVMHVNNETGVIQPLEEIAEILDKHPAFLHVDAAQGFGKVNSTLQNPRIDLMSISAHKIYGPKGVGALVMRRRKYEMPPIKPLFFGGGQERGIRPGTIPVPLVIGLGLAAEIAARDLVKRKKSCLAFKKRLIEAIAFLKPEYNGDQERTLYNTLNVRFPGKDCEAILVAMKGSIAASNGSACTSNSYEPSHVLVAMGYSVKESEEAVRFSWCHMTPSNNELDFKSINTFCSLDNI